MKYIKKVKNIDYHRNGISGEGFHVITFSGTGYSETSENMVAIVFPEPGHVAVLDLVLALAGDIGFYRKADGTFAANAWRGDNFEPELRQAIETWQKAKEAKT